MKIMYNATDRKPLVKAISEFTGAKAVYMKTPTYAYQIDYFTVTREGNLQFDDMADSGEIENLIKFLAQKGFTAKSSAYDSEQQEPVMEGEEPAEDCPPAYLTEDPAEPQEENETTAVCISLPRSLFTEAGIDNLNALLTAKGALIQKALGIDSLPVEVTDETIAFPWFATVPAPDEMTAYETFICKLCEMARNQKRISSTEKAVDNEKYAFRCFLLRLGFIGNEYKTERKILLRNLSGSSAFKGGAKNEISE